MFRRWGLLFLPVCLAFLMSGADKAAPPKKPGPPAKPAPPPLLEAPQPFIAYVFPAGGQCGQTVEVTATGTNLVVAGDKPEINSVFVTGGGVTGRVLEAK